MKNNRLTGLEELSSRLEPENKKVFEYVEDYVSDPDLYDEVTSQSLLADIATHFVEAQKQGISAKEIVGNDPAKYCRELGKNLPRVKGGYKRLVGFAVSWSIMTILVLAASILFFSGNPQPTLYAASLALFPLVMGIFVVSIIHDRKASQLHLKTATILALTLGFASAIFWVFGFWMTEASYTSYLTSLVINSFVTFSFWYKVHEYNITQ